MSGLGIDDTKSCQEASDILRTAADEKPAQAASPSDPQLDSQSGARVLVRRKRAAMCPCLGE